MANAAAPAEPRIRWLFLDLNSYFASVEQELRPELRHRPIAVVPVMADTTCAIAASYEAKAFGVRTGTQVGEAKRMCPGLELVEARHELYVEYHHRVVEAYLGRHVALRQRLTISMPSGFDREISHNR